MSYFDDFEKYQDRIAALDSEGFVITYRELAEFAKKMGNGVSQRSLVFILCKNTVGSMAGYIGLLYNKCVPLMLDANIDRTLLENLRSIYRPSYFYIPEEMMEEEPFCDYDVVGRQYKYVLLKTGDKVTYPLYDELGVLLTTSGSTGSPKLVRQSYQNIQSNAEAIAKYLELTSDERAVTTLPMNYTYGLSVINSHVLVGATMLLTQNTIVSKAFWDFMKSERATSFAGVPFTYEMLKKVKFFRMDLPDLRYFTQAGGKLSPELHKEFAEYALEKGKKFIVMYGQTEATARMSYLPAHKSLEKYGSVGIAIPGGRFSLIDVNGNEIVDSETVGELVYEGPNVTLGYAEEGADLSKADERCGRLETGDMAKRDDDGYYYIVGRKKRFLKLYGNRINLDEIDHIIKREYPELDCASSGTDELMNIYITDAALAQDIEELIAERTHINNNAFQVVVIDRVPRNESGKVLYKDLP